MVVKNLMLALQFYLCHAKQITPDPAVEVGEGLCSGHKVREDFVVQYVINVEIPS